MLDIGALFHIIFASETFIYCLESFHKVPPGKKPAGVFFHQVAMVGSWETPDLPENWIFQHVIPYSTRGPLTHRRFLRRTVWGRSTQKAGIGGIGRESMISNG